MESKKRYREEVSDLFIYILFKVDLHITLQQKPINFNYQN